MILAFLRRLLGARSPSREFASTFVPGVDPTWTPPVPRPWYDAHEPFEPWESAELRRAARLARRSQRRPLNHRRAFPRWPERITR